MEVLLILLLNTLDIALRVIMLMMFARAILSFLPVDEEGKLTGFLALCTEPFILPVRILFDKLGWFAGLPIDIPFFVTYLLLSFITMML